MKTRTLLKMMVFGAATALGCTQHHERTVQSQKERNWLTADPSAISAATPADEPSILPQTYFAAARLQEAQGQLEDAVMQYRKAVTVNHDFVEAYNRMGILLGRLNRHADAENALRRAVELRPNSAHLRNNLGFEYAMQTRWSDAEAELTNAIRLRPDFAKAYVNLGMVLAKQHRFEEALEAFRAALPEEDAFYNLGLMFRAQQRYQDAGEAFNHVLALNADFSAARRQLALLEPKLALASQLEPVAEVEERAEPQEAIEAPPAEQVAVVEAAPPPVPDEPAAEEHVEAALTNAETVVSAEEYGQSVDIDPSLQQTPQDPCPEWDDTAPEPFADDAPLPVAETVALDEPVDQSELAAPVVDEAVVAAVVVDEFIEPVEIEDADEDEPCWETVIEWAGPVETEPVASVVDEAMVTAFVVDEVIEAAEIEDAEEDEPCWETMIEWAGPVEIGPVVPVADEAVVTAFVVDEVIEAVEFEDADEDEPCWDTVIEWAGPVESEPVVMVAFVEDLLGVDEVGEFDESDPCWETVIEWVGTGEVEADDAEAVEHSTAGLTGAETILRVDDLDDIEVGPPHVDTREEAEVIRPENIPLDPSLEHTLPIIAVTRLARDQQIVWAHEIGLAPPRPELMADESVDDLVPCRID